MHADAVVVVVAAVVDVEAVVEQAVPHRRRRLGRLLRHHHLKTEPVGLKAAEAATEAEQPEQHNPDRAMEKVHWVPPGEGAEQTESRPPCEAREQGLSAHSDGEM